MGDRSWSRHIGVWNRYQVWDVATSNSWSNTLLACYHVGMWPDDQGVHQAPGVYQAPGGALLFPEMVAKSLKEAFGKNYLKLFEEGAVELKFLGKEEGRSFHEMTPLLAQHFHQEAAEDDPLVIDLLAPKGADKIAHYNALLDEYDKRIVLLNSEITAMAMTEYATHRATLLDKANRLTNRREFLQKRLGEAILEKREDEAMQVHCVWCGKDCGTIERRDEHEEVCGL